jgi:hypothetical protein
MFLLFFLFMTFTLFNHSFIFFRFRFFCAVSCRFGMDYRLSYYGDDDVLVVYDSLKIKLWLTALDGYYGPDLQRIFRVNLGFIYVLALCLHFFICYYDGFWIYLENRFHYCFSHLFYEFILRSLSFFRGFFNCSSTMVSVSLSIRQRSIVDRFFLVLCALVKIYSKKFVSQIFVMYNYPLCRSNWLQFMFRCMLFLVDCAKLFYVLSLMADTMVSGRDIFARHDFNFKNMAILRKVRMDVNNDVNCEPFGILDCYSLHNFDLRVFYDRVQKHSPECKRAARAARNRRFRDRSVKRRRQ